MIFKTVCYSKVLQKADKTVFFNYKIGTFFPISDCKHKFHKGTQSYTRLQCLFFSIFVMKGEHTETVIQTTDLEKC